MKTLHNETKLTEISKLNRRSFITRTAFGTIGMGLLGSLSVPTFGSKIKFNKSKKEVFQQLDELVDKYFPIYGTCSQTSCAALTEVFQIEADQVLKALAPFPGIALRGETCGAVSGCLASIALAYEADTLKETDKQGLSREPAFKFCTRYESEYGSTRCRDVLSHLMGKKIELTKPEDYAKLREEGWNADCPGMVKQAVHYAAEIIMEKA